MSSDLDHEIAAFDAASLSLLQVLLNQPAVPQGLADTHLAMASIAKTRSRVQALRDGAARQQRRK